MSPVMGVSRAPQACATAAILHVCSNLVNAREGDPPGLPMVEQEAVAEGEDKDDGPGKLKLPRGVKEERVHGVVRPADLICTRGLIEEDVDIQQRRSGIVSVGRILQGWSVGGATKQPPSEATTAKTVAAAAPTDNMPQKTLNQ